MSWKDKAAEYAVECLPQESCGLLAIIKGKETFWPCENLSEAPDEYFIICPDSWAECEDQGELIGIVHSHAYGSALPSEADKASCEHLGLPFYIYSVEHKNWYSFKPSGYKSGLFGRTWIWGKHDCWSLITDYFLEKKQIKLKFWPRPKSLKAFANNPYFEKVLTGSGFKEVNKEHIQENDVLLMEGAEEKLNHVALYIGNQTIFHHNIKQLSCREIYDLRYIQATKKFLDMQHRKLTVYGRLRQFLGQSHFDVAVNNPRQAFAFLIANFPEVENHMTNQLYKIKMGDLEITEDLLEIKGDGDIKIIPIAIGAKGVALGALGVLGGSAAAAATTGFFATAIGGVVASGLTAVGTSMLIDGVTSIIAPTPKVPNFNASDSLSDNDPNVQANFGFNSITNTTRAGVAVPIIYGQVFTGSIVISSGIDTVQVEGYSIMPQATGSGTSDDFREILGLTNPDLPADSLASKQFQTLIDLVSEGVISGFPSATGSQGSTEYNTSALKDVFLNKTQILQQAAPTSPAETDFNFKNITFEPRFGTSNQTAIAGITASESETAVGVTVTKDTPVSRSISDSTVDAVRITIAFPQLQKFEDNGDINGAEVQLSIQIIQNDGTDTTPITDTVKGRAASTYFRDYRINLVDRFGTRASFPVTIRVNRITNDSTDSFLNDSFQWSSFTEIINESRAYADSAHVAIRFDAETFPSVPSRMYRVRGTLIKIPHNGTVRADGSISYNGTFNGTFKTSTGTYSQSGTTVTITISNHGLAVGDVVSIEYTSGSATDGDFTIATKSDANTFTVTAATSASNSGNVSVTLKEYSNDPAWVLYDLLTTSKGFGDHIDTTQLDVYSFYSASVYCSEQVDDMTGNNTTEARFSTNVVLNTQRDAYSLINDLSSVMRVMPFYSAGVINISQDRPTDPSYVYNLSNVTSEGFSYSNASKSTKATVVNVGYFDNETQTIDYETVEDTALQAKYGVVVRNLKGFATTSRGQAARLGKWFLYTQSNEAEICSFKTSIESGTIVRVGTIISVQDPMRAGVRRGGRIKTGVSTTQIVVDDSNNTDLVTSDAATLSVILSDGTLETKSISSISGTTVTVSSAFSSVPQANSVWVIENSSLSLQTFRVFSVKEVNQLEYEIQAVAHNSSKYASVEDGSTLQSKTISNISALKPSPSNLQGSEQIVVLNNRAVSKLFIQWQPVSGVTEYMVQFRFKNENFISEKVKRPDFTIFETQLGSYEIRVFSYNALGKPSTTPATTTFTTVGKTALPADPSGLTLEPVSDQFVRLRFNAATDVDVVHGGTVSVRHTPSVDPAVATFQNSTEIIPKLAGNITETLVPALTGTYSIKFIDDTGNRSNNAARIIVTAPDPQPNQVILTEREDTDSPPFQGEKVNTFYDATFDGLLLDGTLLWDSITQNIDDLSNIDFAGPINSSGSYEFQNKVDMGSVFNLMLKRRFVTSGLLVNDLIDSRTALIDTWTEFDGSQADDVNAKLLVATTDIDPATSVSATYEQSGTTITITKTDHGYSVGDFVVIDFTAGSATDGNYEIQTVPNANTFTVTASASATISSGTSCTYGANFTQFNTFANGEYTARGFKFKCELESNDPAQNINVTELGYEASVKRRTETVNTAIASQCGTTGSAKTVTFDSPFFVGTASLGGSTTAFLPTVGITLEGAASGDFFNITSITGTQFVIETRSSSGLKDLSFKYTAIGFGKGT